MRCNLPISHIVRLILCFFDFQMCIRDSVGRVQTPTLAMLVNRDYAISSFKKEKYHLLLAGICLFAMTTLFSFITLPVEINASQRALVWLSKAY